MQAFPFHFGCHVTNFGSCNMNALVEIWGGKALQSDHVCSPCKMMSIHLVK